MLFSDSVYVCAGILPGLLIVQTVKEANSNFTKRKRMRGGYMHNLITSLNQHNVLILCVKQITSIQKLIINTMQCLQKGEKNVTR
jgi:hypothetical protein